MWLLALVQYVWGYLGLLKVMLIFKGMEFKKHIVAPKCKTISSSGVQLGEQQTIPNQKERVSLLDLPRVTTLGHIKRFFKSNSGLWLRPYTLTLEANPFVNFKFTVWHYQTPERMESEKLTSGFHSLSASANTMQGLFPPSSRVTLFRLLFPAASLIILPTWNGALQKRRLTLLSWRQAYLAFYIYMAGALFFKLLEGPPGAREAEKLGWASNHIQGSWAAGLSECSWKREPQIRS